MNPFLNGRSIVKADKRHFPRKSSLISPAHIPAVPDRRAFHSPKADRFGRRSGHEHS
jgi:hypothetical protein